MPRPKQQTREERLEKRRLYERRRKERIKSNEVSREEFLRKDRERYARKKAAGLIVSRHLMTPKKLRILRRKNKISAAAYYQRKINRAAPAPIAARANPLDETIGDQSDGPGLSTSCHSSFLPTLRRSLRLNSNSISTNIQIQRSNTTEARSFHRVYTSSPRQTLLSTHQNFVNFDYSNPGPSTSRQGNPSSARRCLPMNSDSTIGSNIQHHIDDNVVTGTHCVQPSGVQRITCPSNLSSIESTLCPNSPVSDSSITSVEFKRGLKDKFRKYQKTKTKLITELQNKLLQVTKEKEMFKKRCNRLQSNHMILKKSTQKGEKPAVEVIKPDEKKNRILRRVVKFLEDDENSTLCPGKNDTISRLKTYIYSHEKRLISEFEK